MKNDTKATIKRAEHFQLILIGEGILVGALAGLVIIAYRLALEYASELLQTVIAFIQGKPFWILEWFLMLLIMAMIVAKLVDFEPMISGSGIPQLEGEMIGRLNQSWWRVLLAKFTGGFLCLLGGMALGREGPSIQLGAMVGKGISEKLDRGKTEERFLLTCGASAGLAAAFHAPLAGVMFSLEEVHKNFSVSVLMSVMASSLTADYLASNVFGMKPVFDFDIVKQMPTSYYWMILLLGLTLGVLGAFYNWFTLFVQGLYQKAGKLSTTQKLIIPFMLCGLISFWHPELLGSGHSLIQYLTNSDVMLRTVVFILVTRFVFSAICFGSGAPGGIFFPLLVLGGFIGGVFATIGVQFFGLDPMYINNFVLLSMAGYFSAIVRAPLTGVILIFEMTGNLHQMLSLSIVAIISYIVATGLRSKPIYESLLARLLAKKEPTEEEKKASLDQIHGQKVLSTFFVPYGEELDGKLVSQVQWPRHCLLVAIQRGSEEIIPKGQTRLQGGDAIVTLTDERDLSYVIEKMEKLCNCEHL